MSDTEKPPAKPRRRRKPAAKREATATKAADPSKGQPSDGSATVESAPAEEAAKPRRRRRSTKKPDAEVQSAAAESAPAEEAAPPRRRRSAKKPDAEVQSVAAESAPAEEAATPRRRRRSAKKPETKAQPAEAELAASEPAASSEPATPEAGAPDGSEADSGPSEGRSRRRRSRGGRRRSGRGRNHDAPAEPYVEVDQTEAFEAWGKDIAKARVELPIPDALMSQDAVRVVEKLREAGHFGYVVGGCVRDLALGTAPKDFDVATSARPEKVRRLFRNARIVGRRFRLVHVRFGRDRMIEVATFRAAVPEPTDGLDGDLLITDDNEYGSPLEDAQRRDFTINGLFYDPADGSVVDFVGGVDDLKAKTIRCIGDADVRMQEDPVRMLRAVRFAAKLHFEFDPELALALRRHAATIHRCAPARVWEELLKLLRCGAVHRVIPLASQVGLLAELLPEVEEVFRTRGDMMVSLLQAIDELTHERGEAPDDAVLLAALMLPMVPAGRPGRFTERTLDGWADRYRIPRRLRERVTEMVIAVRFMLPRGPWVDPTSFARRAVFDDALALLEVVVRAEGDGKQLLKHWRHHRQPEVSEEHPG
jgi:poly(A) polymerase